LIKIQGRTGKEGKGLREGEDKNLSMSLSIAECFQVYQPKAYSGSPFGAMIGFIIKKGACSD
jgi:hypothetical protein